MHYLDQRNLPEEEVTSGLSPYLHFGHISAHEIFQHVVKQEQWSVAKVLQSESNRKTGRLVGDE